VAAFKTASGIVAALSKCLELETAQATNKGRQVIKVLRIAEPSRLAITLLVLGLVPIARADAPQEPTETPIPVLTTRTASYTNVTITATNGAGIFFLHRGGVGNVRFDELERESYAVLGLEAPEPEGPKQANVADRLEGMLPPWLVRSGKEEEVAQRPPALPELTRTSLFAIGGFVLGIHLLYSWCFASICRKARRPSSLLVWLPVFQALPLFRAARMSGWLLLLMIVPLLNVIVLVAWCFRIVHYLRHSRIWALFLILPGTSVIALLYLAFSSDKHMNDASGSHPTDTVFMTPGMCRT